MHAAKKQDKLLSKTDLKLCFLPYQEDHRKVLPPGLSQTGEESLHEAFSYTFM